MKQKKQIEEIERLSLFKPLLNWILFILINATGAIVFIYAKDIKPSTDTSLILLLLSGIFLFYGLTKQNTGEGYIKQWYNIFERRSWLVDILSNIPQLLFLIWLFLFIIFEKAWGILLFASMFTFMFPICMGFVYLILQEFIKINKKKRGKHVIRR